MKRQSRFNELLCVLSLVAIGVLTLAGTAQAATYVWDAEGGVVTTWSELTNWSPDGVPAFAAGDIFDLSAMDITAPGVSTVDASVTLGIINIGDAVTSSHSWTLANSGVAVITLDNGGSNSQINQTATSFGDTISAPLALAGSLDITNLAAAKVLTISTGGITSSALTGIQTISNLGSAAGGVTISGVIGDNPTPSTGIIAITQNASGTLTLSGANTYTGQTTVTLGTLNAFATDALGTGAALLVNGGTLDISTFRSAIGAVTLTSGSVTGSGGTLTGASFAVESGSASAILDGSGATLTKTTAGTVTLSGANTYTGATTISGGVLRANNGVGLPSTASTGGGSYLNIAGGVFETGADLERAGGTGQGQMQITSGTSGFSANGGAVQVAFGTIASPTNLTWGTAPFQPDTLILNAVTANNTLDFKNAVNLGTSVRTVAVDATGPAAIATMSGNLSSGDGGGLTKTGVGTLTLSGANTYTGATTLSAGTLVADNATALGNGGDITFGGGTLQFTASSEGSDWAARIKNSTAGAIKLDTNSRNVTFAGIIGNTNTAGLTKSGDGTLTLSGANTYTGATTISAGTLVADHATALGDGGDITFGGGTLQFTANSEGQDWAALIKNSTAGAITLDTNSRDVTFAGIIGNTNTAGLTKSGDGTLILSGANTYTGTTTISGGTLKLANNLALQNSAFDTSSAGAFDVTATNTPTFGGLIGSINLVLPANVTALTLNPGTGVVRTYSGSLSGGTGMTLTKTGAGTQVLSGANLYTGDTIISAGLLQLGIATAIPNGVGYGNVVLDGGDSAAGTLNLTGKAVTLNGLSGTSGTVLGQIVNNNIAPAAATLTVGNNNATSSFAGTIANGNNSVALVKIGTGTLTLTGTNTYTGDTTVKRGTLTINPTSGTNSANGTITTNWDTVAADSVLNLYGTTVLAANKKISMLSGTTINLYGTATVSGTGLLEINNTGGGGGILNVMGTLNLNGTGDNRVGYNTNSTAPATLHIADGGVVNVNNGIIFRIAGSALAVNTYSRGTLTMDPGSAMTLDNSDGPVGFVITSSTGTVNGCINNNNVGTVNLNGGLLTTGRLIRVHSQNVAIFNFNGGTLKTTVASDNFLNLVATKGPAVRNALSRANVRDGGAIIDTNGYAITIPEPLVHSNIGGDAALDGGLTKNGLGQLTLSGAGTYTGNTLINAGTLKLANNLALQNSAFDTSSAGALDVTATNTPTFGGLIGSTNLALPANVTALTLNPGTGFTKTYSGSLSGGTGMTLTKTGAGTQILSGNNSYAGGTTITAGILVAGDVNALGTAGTIANNATLAIAGGVTFARPVTWGTSSVLAGVGTYTPGGTFTVGGTGNCPTLSPGIGAGNIGTLTIGNALTLNGATLTWEAASTSSYDKVAVTGDLTLSGINTLVTTAVADGTYDIMTYTGSLLEGGGTNLTAFVPVATRPGRYTFDTTTTPKTVQMIVADSGTVVNYDLIWSGGVSNAWIIPSPSTPPPLNWTGGDSKYYNGDTVTFNDDSAVGTVQLTKSSTAAIQPASVTVDNSTTAYTFNGDPISGAGTLTKSGDGTLTINTANTYTGDTIISGGTLVLGSATAIPNGAGFGNVVLDGGDSAAGTLDLNDKAITLNGLSGTSGTVLGKVVNNGAAAVTLTVGNNNAISSFAGTIANGTGTGTVALVKTGSGTLTLGGANTYTGPTTVNAGTLVINAGTVAQLNVPAGGTANLNAAAMATAASVTGGALALNGSVTGELLVTGGAVNVGSGVSVGTANINAGTVNATNPLTVTNSARLGGITVSASGPAFTLQGANILAPDADNRRLITAQGGTLTISSLAYPTSGLLGRWTFDDATANDSSGNHYNGTQVNSPTYSAATHDGSGQALVLDSNSAQYVKVDTGGTQSVFDGRTAMTVSAWVKGWPIAAWGPFVSKNGEAGQGWQMRRNSGSTTLNWTTRGVAQGDNGDFTGITTIVSNGDWHMVTMTYDGATKNIYVDGALDNSTAATGTIAASTSTLVFGARDNPAGTFGGFFTGSLDDIYFYNRALSAGEVTTAYANNTSDVDLSTTDIAATASSELSLPVGASKLGGLSLSGSGTQLTLSGAANASLDKITATDTSSIAAGAPISLRTGDVSVSDGKMLTVGTNIVDVSGTVATALNKLGAGTLVLSGANTYTGETIVKEGTLSITNLGNLADASTVEIYATAVMDLAFAGSDTIADLWLGGVLMATGTYDRSDSVYGSYFTSDGSLKVDHGALDGDANEDGVVDAADYIILKQKFGMTSGVRWAQGDFNGNHQVDWDDLQLLMANFGTRSVGGAPATPEPATLGLLAIGALAVIRRRRK